MKNPNEMSPEQYRAALKKMHTSQLGAARLLKIAPRTSRRWAALNKDVGAPIPPIAARFINYIVITKKTAKQVIRKLEE